MRRLLPPVVLAAALAWLLPMAPRWAAPAPAYYPPPYAAPTPTQPRRQARLCRAWPVSCPLPWPLAEGDACGCPSNRGQLPCYASP